MLFEALVSRLDPGSQRLKEACNGGLFLRADGFVTTAHAYHRAVPEVSDEGGMNLLLLGDGHLPIRPNQTPSKLSELVPPASSMILGFVMQSCVAPLSMLARALSHSVQVSRRGQRGV